MNKRLRHLAASAVSNSPLQYWPVSVRAGLAKGARWTLAPFSANWRQGGEIEIAKAVAMLPRLRGAACWDVGAHFGIHAVGMAMQVGPDGEVCAFEPDTVAFARMQRHVRMNRLRNIKLFQLAASDHDGALELVVSGGLGSTVTHVRYDDEEPSPEAAVLNASAIRLDSLVSAGEIRVPDLVKIDVEGHGGRVLEGALDTVGRCKPIIVFSVHSESEWSQARQVLMPLGYAGKYASGRECRWDAHPDASAIIFTCK